MKAIENWKAELAARQTRGKNPKRHRPKKLAFSNAIRHNNDANLLNT